MSDIERELESELHRVLDPLSALPIPARRAPSHATGLRAVLGGAGTALALKLVTGVAVAAAAVTVAGTATTGSPNPLVWGQRVSTYVTDCKAKLSDGQHGIGDCVSDFSSTHGATVASNARHQGNGNGAANAHGNNPNANDHARDKSRDHTQAAPKNAAPGDPEPVDQPFQPPVTIPPQR